MLAWEGTVDRLERPEPLDPLRQPPATMTLCPNCGHEARGRFCDACGQAQGDLMPSVASWIKDAVDELFGVNGKLPRSIRSLVWPPGDLTLEWHRGRRVRFVNPFRLYLGTALLFFLAWQHTSFASGLEGFIRSAVEARGESTTVVSQDSIQGAAQIITETLPGLLIIFFVPVFAMGLHLANRRSGAFAGDLVMALHIHTVFFLGIVVTIPVSFILGARWTEVGEPVLFVMLFAFLCASVARVYGLPWWRATARSLLLVSAYSVVASVSLILIVGGLV